MDDGLLVFASGFGVGLLNLGFQFRDGGWWMVDGG